MNRTDTVCRCHKCEREQRVSFAGSLRGGWPVCCGYTMMLVSTRANIERAVKRVLRPGATEGRE